MRPAGSILLLTTLTGFGYGLLAWLGAYAALGLLPVERTSSLLVRGVVVSLALASLGLGASVLHLGRKTPAWRAVSQWRSSWLSREALVAMITYPIAIGFAIAIYGNAEPIWTRLLGLIALAASLGTVYCTAMIYASLKPIRQWHNAHTAPDYLLYAIFSGAMLFAALHTAVFGELGVSAGLAAAATAAVALVAKQAYWRHIDRQTPLATLARAIGLPRAIEARPLDAPHYTENFVLREMGYAIARRHASRLRSLVLTIGFALPLALSLLGSFAPVPPESTWLSLACAALGLLTERWLFFAEATHVSALYYGRKI